MSNHHCIIKRHLDEWADQPAIIDDQFIMSYQALSDAIDRRCERIPFSHRTLVASVSGTLNDIVLILACQRLGRCLLPLNPSFPTEYVQKILSGLEYEYWAEPENSENHPINHNKVLEGCKELFPANWILTSGSTSLPKVAVLSHLQHIASASGALKAFPVNPGSRFLQSLPLFHISGLATLYRCFMSGSTLILNHSAGCAQWFVDQKISHCSFVPTQLIRLLNQSVKGQYSFKQILLGGGPIPDSLIENNTKLPIYKTYGLTEMASQVVTQTPIGKSILLPGRELQIDDTGEVLLKGDTLFSGYQTNSGLIFPVDQDGWFHSGDLGKWHEGRFIIYGRIDNQFISGGENIQPETIEACLHKHPSIVRAIVVPTSDLIFGARPVAFVESESFDPNRTASTITSWLKNKLPGFMQPIAYFELPPSNGIKVQRAELKTLAESLIDEYLDKKTEPRTNK